MTLHMPHPGLPCNKDCGAIGPNNTVQILITMKLDGTGYGTFSTPESALEVTKALINQSIPWYFEDAELVVPDGC